MGHRSQWWSAFSLATLLMIAACWLICAVPVWLGWLDSSVSRVAFFIPISGLGVPFFIGWLTARRTGHPDPSASASGVFLAVLGFCLGLGLQDALLHRAPAAFVVMLGVGGVLGLVAGLSALVGHGAVTDGGPPRIVSLPEARVLRRRKRRVTRDA
jgi:hypothetical protein